MKLHYDPGKANVVADALSQKSYDNTLLMGGLPEELAEDLWELRLEIVLSTRKKDTSVTFWAE